jgi:hypothetical protein
VRERLDAIYEAAPEVSEVDPLIEHLQAASLPREDW